MTTNEPRCCLINPTTGTQIPLLGVQIEATLKGLSSQVTVNHRYRNTEELPIEAVYVFPLEEGSAVCGFQAHVGDRHIVGQIEEKERAFERYDDAMADGHGAFLLDQERPNIFTASLGNLKPGEDVTVQIKYVALLNYEGSSVRFMLPSTVSPRYAPETGPEVGQPDAERVNPPTLPAVPYGMSISVHIDLDGPIRTVESPSHTVRTELEDSAATVTLSTQTAAMDRDFVLLIEPRKAAEPTARVSRQANGTRVVMVSFHPSEDELGSAGGQEITFILDCSGSMQGDSIVQARRALELCVRAMTEADTFNIVPFGSDFQSLWDTPQPYNQANLEEATDYIQGCYANLGGTEILSPLQHVLERPADPRRPRKVLLLTDGEVVNEEAVISMARKHRQSAHVFTFGIGAGCSEHLIRGIAKASRAAAEFIFPGERIEPKVLRMFGRIRTPALGEISLDWGQMQVEAAPQEVPPVFGGDALTVFARVRSGDTDTVTLSAGSRRWTVPVDLEKASLDDVVPTLWARKRIEELEMDKPRKGSNQRRPKSDTRQSQIIDLAMRYGLMSRYTSYVAIEERVDAEKTHEQAELRRVPIALTTGWGGSQTMVSGGMIPSAAPSAQFHTGALQPPPMRTRSMAAPVPGCAQKKSVAGAVVNTIANVVDSFLGQSPPGSPKARSGRPSSPALGKDAVDLYDILLTQNADGSFPLSRPLKALIGAHKGALTDAINEHGEDVVATAIALALLRQRFADRSDEWKAGAAKAQAWLDQRGAQFDATGYLA